LKPTPSGFSLLELLVVLLIMSVTVGLVLGTNFRQKETVVIRSFVSEFSHFLRTARSHALLDGLENICIYHHDDKKVVETLRGRSVEIPQEVELIFGDAVNANKFDLVSFYPDGSVIVEDFFIKSSRHKYFPEVEPFMGKVQFQKVQ
jgi:prepilin-type N-terminal cleavage/methylation domain-containing protein